jgi:hypothetical protein
MLLLVPGALDAGRERSLFATAAPPVRADYTNCGLRAALATQGLPGLCTHTHGLSSAPVPSPCMHTGDVCDVLSQPPSARQALTSCLRACVSLRQCYRSRGALTPPYSQATGAAGTSWANKEAAGNVLERCLALDRYHIRAMPGPRQVSALSHTHSLRCLEQCPFHLNK